ncbi:MAG: aminotransferase class I/II-fold pyridoxal phosphate-dependent enzyme [Campylobacterota bacterium]|nr:aminotransferase class I/II-fold pyridoxal phosphate-dependent enzyme [Campylobacterota bacterium]
MCFTNIGIGRGYEDTFSQCFSRFSYNLAYFIIGLIMNRFEEFTTQFVQQLGKKDGAVSPVIANSASFGYGDAQIAEGIFDGSVKKPLYARVGNPTSAQLESVLATMDGGVGAIATSTGMAATTLATMSLLKSGDDIISVGGLFGGTYSFFSETLSRFGMKTQFFDVDEFEAIEKAITQKTKIIFLESVGNPNMRLPDIAKIASIANQHGIVLIVDNTTTPLSIAPLKLGADIVVYSTTKIVTGNASSLGGAAVFRAIREEDDKFKTPRYEEVHKFIKKMGKMALIANAKKRAMRDFGMSANAFGSYLTMLGLETLPLRMDRVVSSVEKIVSALDEAGLHVNHPSLSSHPHHERYKTEFSQGCGSLLTIDMETKEKAFAFINRLKLATITANIGDSRTLVLHMASTIYSDFSEEIRAFLGITDGLIRVSIGLENPKDIIKDFLDASV